MAENQNSQNRESSEMNKVTVCVTDRCNEEIMEGEDGFCFGCQLAAKMIRGWYKQKKVWEWTHANLIGAEHLQLLMRCAKREFDNPPSSSPRKLPEKLVQWRAKRRRMQKRCGANSCLTKVETIGFRCRCGGTFCIVHRCSEAHLCKVNYRELGALEICKNNPRVVADKVIRI